ncbi:MAG: xylulokinase [bacterium]|nr:xylulokinase [Deltaproteobacteria bacterium]MCP4903703.1 xylulokinase [bacterium]
MYLGIDLGTSAVKAVLADDSDRIIAQESALLEISRPHPLWSEQDPEAWWSACDSALRALGRCHDLRSVRGIGLSGQMHGATLLGADDKPLRPAILWNDGRSISECEELERVPRFRAITGNLAMPGFTAPKLLWVREHEPEVFERLRCVLLPKDVLRLRMTGDAATDLSDAAGTLWLDVARREWSSELIEATGLRSEMLPTLFEGNATTGVLRSEVATAWGMERVPVAAGAGDQAAGAIGVGVVRSGEASLSLGTSGVLFVASDSFKANADRAVHSFCHCLPETWHQMSVILSAASCLSWLTRLVGAEDEAALLAEVEAVDRPNEQLIFLPYLSGERTPHNDPHATGTFIGLDHDVDAAAMGRAVLEGVAFAFADAQAALTSAGTRIDAVSVIGGGARSLLWGRIMASVLDRPLVYRTGGEVGPAQGAARLARLAVTGEAPEVVCKAPPVAFEVEPDAGLRDLYGGRLDRYRDLYGRLRGAFR